MSLVVRKGEEKDVKKPSLSARRALNRVPQEILDDPLLNACISQLPSNYSFEIPKTIWRLRLAGSKLVALQFPEGLLMYSMLIADIIEKFTDADTIIMGDVTYGACCVDDLTAASLGADFLVHYGHSCIVPIDETKAVNTLYVFVDIQIDVRHFVESVKKNMDPSSTIAMVGTIQFSTSLHTAKEALRETFDHIVVPQSRPLSQGEILGCTSPKIGTDVDALIYLGDGRFHLESIMISNPGLSTFRYDPYSKVFSKEGYDTEAMLATRGDAARRASGARKFGIILGTLGRQGNTKVLEHVRGLMDAKGVPYVVVLLSEIFPQKLDMFEDVEAWVQIACPRLSIDWGYAFSRPLLNPYEAEVALGASPFLPVYPMDFYSAEGGPWSVGSTREKRTRRKRKTQIARKDHIAVEITE